MDEQNTVKVTLKPLGIELLVPRGSLLRDVLYEQGVEFPCGGQGRCRGCRVHVTAGQTEIEPTERDRLSPVELAEGWRLSCQAHATGDLTLELRQWDATILANDTAFTIIPQEGLGIAVDIGTTTLAAQLLSLEDGRVLSVKTALNTQSRFGGDVMSRVEAAVTDGHADELRDTIRRETAKLIGRLLAEAGESSERLRKITIVGNTVMHHLFCGVSLEPLSHYPFEAVDDGLKTFSPDQLGWELPGAVVIQFLPCLGGFVGSDILAGILATGILESDELVGLVDLGTNGEIVFGNREKLLCASTAAGPAFEGARIGMGMRASSGAIWKVTAADGELVCETLGGAEPKGICGSGLVDAVAVALDLGMVRPNGKIAGGDRLMLADPVSLDQTDIRQLQLAKGAISAGIQILLNQCDVGAEQIPRLYLAGAFGNYVNRASARRIGLIKFAEDRVFPVGNSALLGAKMALFASYGDAEGYARIRDKVTHVTLSSDPAFMETYVDEMRFPG